jgi:hypothetical protein
MRPKQKKIYYVPGIFTLIFLPILIVTKTDSELAKRREYVIDFSIYTDNQKDEFSFLIPAQRNYIPIFIKGKTYQDSLSYLMIENMAKAIELSKDTTLGLKIIIEKKVKYSSFIQTINQLLKAKVKTYIPYGDTIFVYYMKRKDHCLTCNIPRNWYFIDDVNWTDDFYTLEEYKKIRWIIWRNIFMDYFHYWPFFLLYLILVVSAFKRIRIEYKNQKSIKRN